MTIAMLRAVCAATALLGLSSCVTPPDSNAPAPGAQDSYVVLGVAPSDVSLQIVDGKIGKGVFHTAIVQLLTLSYMPDADGYIVMKVPGNTHYAIKSAVMTIGHVAFLGEQFQPSGAETLVFDAPAGKVVYVTSLQYHRGRGSLEMEQNPNLESARSYLRQRYPNLADRLEQDRYGLMPLSSWF